MIRIRRRIRIRKIRIRLRIIRIIIRITRIRIIRLIITIIIQRKRGTKLRSRTLGARSIY